MKETIEVHTFQLFVKGGRKALSFSEGKDLYEILKTNWVSFIDGKTGPIGDPESDKRTLRIPHEQNGTIYHGYNDQMRCIYGIIETGVYGKKLEIVNKDNPREALFQSDAEGAVIKPFFYLICIPHIGDLGYIIVERTDGEGVTALMVTLLNIFFHENLPYQGDTKDYSVRLKNYLSHEYVESLQNGKLKSVRLNISKLPKDLADRYMLQELDTDASISIVVNFKNGILPNHRVAKAIKNNDSIFMCEEINDLFRDSTRSIVTTSDNNGVQRERTVYLDEDNIQKIRPYYLLDVEENDRGYASFNSIKQASFDFINSNEELKNLK